MDVFLRVIAELDAPGIGHFEEVLIFFECNLLVELASKPEVTVDNAEG